MKIFNDDGNNNNDELNKKFEIIIVCMNSTIQKFNKIFSSTR